MKDHTSDRDGWPGDAPTRLRELRAGDLGEDAAWAVELLREAPGHRLKPAERQRVLLGIGRVGRGRRRPWVVRLAATAAVLVAATAIARAGLLGNLPRWLTGLARAPSPTPQASDHPVSGTIRHHESAAPALAIAAPIASQPAPVPEPAPADAMRATQNAKRRARRVTAATERPDGDAGLVVQAMRALRRDDDPALARALCAAYLERHPEGALAEEALALTIEAAVARHEPDAPALGARYLRQYPNGPFQGLARQASGAGVVDSN